MYDTDNQALLWLKFYGPQLEIKSVPIYELGQTLVALQTIIHKVYWYKQEPLPKRKIGLSRESRNQLALRVKERRTGSDIYGLVPFLSDPLISGIITSLLGATFYALGSYVYKRIKGKDNSPEAPITSAIYNQVNIIVDRINNIGGISKIEISVPSEPKPLVFDESVREYVRGIRSEPIFGDLTEIEGQLIRLDVRHYTGFIQTRSGYVRIYLSPEDFDQIRYQSQGAPTIVVEGQYLYFLGREGSRFDEFRVSKIIDIQPES